MDQTHFKIAPVVVQAYRLVWAERAFLLKTAVIPFAVSLATSVFVMQAREGSGLIEDFLWHIPATVLMGWFLFAQTRLLFFGERLTPRDAQSRGLAEKLRLTIIIWLLFNMLQLALVSALFWAAQQITPGEGSPYNVLGFFLIGIILWSLRYGLLHIVAAAGDSSESVTRFFFKIDGIRLSFRLLGMSFLTALPMIFAFQIMVSVFFAGQGPLTEEQRTAIFLLSAPVSFLITAMLNAAGCCAIRAMPVAKQGKKS